MKAISFSLRNPGFHMHDCYINQVVCNEQALIFQLKYGLYVWNNGEYLQTGPAKLVFSKPLLSDCEIQYLRNNRRECVDVKVLQEDLKSGYIDLIYEMYNESSAHFEGILIQGSEWKTVEINIFFQKFEILYEEERGFEHE